MDEELWDRPWATLSGGEAQRISLATAVGLDCADILLLDGNSSTFLFDRHLVLNNSPIEPTSALDADSSTRVEKRLQNMLKADDSCTKALVWITHSAEQGQRVGTRFIEVSNGSCREVLVSDSAV